ncbi:SAM hydrolase/SAM-dependent halogenase family protein [Beggiatoa leptomitoformis]|uniref:SAM-dependent chlorinase/fluorinase n=1 Tax=Beggiatoa leptomitoformis TaxID=288004 RepID=A0A2N9YJI5_9GAMM|nr:SAM-dependent chlorinase/fluorinase [Beggiatoa leptomitoformis]AUI70396.1 hypothetical protein BLE401_17950 [Beggiatoa leptomitoformis]QGX03604.1 hypothetical protein AL038_06355 [Beggiatoa leptomitoformis]
MLNPLITLITDFGTQDGYVGAMKGYLLQACPTVRLVDISHDIEPQNIYQAAWCLTRSAPHFPPETIHIIVVDPSVGSSRPPLLLRALNQWFVAPDNGIFTELVNRYPPETIYQLHRKTAWWQAHRSFDGLALFAPAAACLANGVTLDKLGIKTHAITELLKSRPQRVAHQLLGKIILFDRFGNALTNISAEDLASLPAGTRQVSCQEQLFPLLNHYAEGENTQLLALINSDGMLELSVYCQSAQQQCHLHTGDSVTVQY